MRVFSSRCYFYDILVFSVCFVFGGVVFFVFCVFFVIGAVIGMKTSGQLC